MGLIITSTPEEKVVVDLLLSKNLPSYRQAYSDRTAWVMACLSELAYVRFNPLFKKDDVKGFILDKVTELAGSGKKTGLLKLIDMLAYDHEEEREKLIRELGGLNIKLEEGGSFDVEGTQAILVSCDAFIALAFRGTESNSIKDIKADLDAKGVNCASGGRVHAGFNRAFNTVLMDIQQKLDQAQYADKPLIITGHSLGGALATIAAKRLTHKGQMAACYTFGSPRVGDEEWISTLKTPVYRVVNAADCVTMLPPGGSLLSASAWSLGWIPGVGSAIKTWMKQRYDGYLHGGDMRYLSNCKSGEYSQVRLLPSVSFFFRIKQLILKQSPWTNLLADHSISTYRKKLTIIADRRNRG
ncbi:MAG: triacylglycerol lipase [Motiliproteus sp.]|jgi:triacylglycerol lipase